MHGPLCLKVDREEAIHGGFRVERKSDEGFVGSGDGENGVRKIVVIVASEDVTEARVELCSCACDR